MLEKLLRRVATQGTACSVELARGLGVSDALMQNMLEELARKGYLTTVIERCAVACERCPTHRACLYHRQARIWMLSAKGESLLARRNEQVV